MPNLNAICQHILKLSKILYNKNCVSCGFECMQVWNNKKWFSKEKNSDARMNPNLESVLGRIQKNPQGAGVLTMIFFGCCFKVSKVAKIRNRYNQVPHLTKDTNGKVTNSQKTPQTRAKRSALSQQVTTKHI